jgi:hypothetical protein
MRIGEIASWHSQSLEALKEVDCPLGSTPLIDVSLVLLIWVEESISSNAGEFLGRSILASEFLLESDLAQ